MAIAIKGLLALFWLVVVPFAAGIPFLQKKQKCMAPEYPTGVFCFLQSRVSPQLKVSGKFLRTP